MGLYIERIECATAVSYYLYGSVARIWAMNIEHWGVHIEISSVASCAAAFALDLPFWWSVIHVEVRCACRCAVATPRWLRLRLVAQFQSMRRRDSRFLLITMCCVMWRVCVCVCVYVRVRVSLSFICIELACKCNLNDMLLQCSSLCNVISHFRKHRHTCTQHADHPHTTHNT